tara:strand:+ start:133 stop:1563 length:1431 start_codon:yes stop_codon:yes gene_type:complete
MKIDDLIEYINDVRWEDVKDLPEVSDRVYLNEDLGNQDRELENSNYLYLTIFSQAREDGKDRYFGSNTNSTIKGFMDSDYKGSPKKHKDIFEKSESEYEHRTICLRISDNESKILIEEEDILDGIDARENPKFFNASNISGGIQKTLGNQQVLFDEITENIEKTNRGEVSDFEVGEENVHKLHALERAQPRSGDLDPSHVNAIAKDILDNPKRALESIRKTILLEDYYAPGIHKRGGNTHSLNALIRPSLKNYVDKIGFVLVPKSLWSKCSPHNVRDILLWDNKREWEISRKCTNSDEIIQSCWDLINDFKLSHLHKSVKLRAKALGMVDSEWSGPSGICAKLKDLVDNKSTEGYVPENMDIIKYTPAKIESHEKEKSSPDGDVIVLTTVYAGGNKFTGWDLVIRWLSDPKNKKRQLHIDFLHGMNGIQRYADLWPDKQKDLVPLINKLFTTHDKKSHFTWDMMPRFEPKKNMIHD